MTRKEAASITYHLAYFPTVEDADFTLFETLVNKVGGKSDFPDYISFASDISRTTIVKECHAALKDEFYYALAFERDGGFQLRVHPKVSERALFRLPPEERTDMMKCFDAVSETIEDRSGILWKQDREKKARENRS